MSETKFCKSVNLLKEQLRLVTIDKRCFRVQVPSPGNSHEIKWLCWISHYRKGQDEIQLQGVLENMHTGSVHKTPTEGLLDICMSLSEPHWRVCNGPSLYTSCFLSCESISLNRMFNSATGCKIITSYFLWYSMTYDKCLKMEANLKHNLFKTFPFLKFRKLRDQIICWKWFFFLPWKKKS